MVVDLTQLLQLTINGLVLGSVLALAAVGLTLVYGILDLANFAHGDLITLGAYLGLFFAASLTIATTLAWALAIAGAFLVLILGDRFLRAPMARVSERISDQPALSRRERMVGGYASLLLVAMVLGVRPGVAIPAGTGVLAALGAVAVGLLVQDALSTRREHGGFPRGLGVAALLTPPVAAILVLAVGPVTGWSITWSWGLALGLLASVLYVGIAESTSLAGPWTNGGLALGGLVGAILLAEPMLLAVALTLILVGVGSMILDRVIWRPMREQDAGLLTLIIISIGLALVIRNAVIIRSGTGVVDFPGASQAPLEVISSVFVTRGQLVVIGVTLLCIGLVHVLLRHTRMGKAMRALADDMALARITGIDVDRVILYVWFIAGALAALAGVLLGTIRPFTTNVGWFLLLPIFAAVILGGIGSPYGAMAGGYVIGLTMETSLAFGVPSDYRLAVGFAIMILVLVLRPQGIFGGQATR